MINFLLEQLNLNKDRISSIKAFSENYRLKSYVEIINENPYIIEELKKIYPKKIKDNWDCVVELYRYNIKLSKAIYPYLDILENIIKVRISEYLKNKYGSEYYYNDELFLRLLNLNDFDRKILYKYFNNKINKFVREDIVNEYIKYNKSISKKSIKNKLRHIKQGISILSDANEYRFKNKNSNVDDFIESKPTLNYWITLLEIKDLYIKDTNSIELDLKSIFPNIKQENIETLKDITRKLDDIRLLRNSISHYNRIIYTNISKNNYDLWDIYENIKEIFYLLGCNDIDYVIGDISCCNRSNFEYLYHLFDFLHNAYKNRKNNFNIKSE